MSSPRRPLEQITAIALLVVMAILVVSITGLLLAGSPPPTTSSGSSPSAAPSTFSSAAPSTSPSAGASPTGEPATPSPTQSTPAGSPSASPPASAALDELVVKWINPPGASGLDDLRDLTAAARMGDRFVIVGGRARTSSDGPRPAIWWSDNATTWELATLPDGYESSDYAQVDDVVAGGTGFVAVAGGTPIWSENGKEWFESMGSTIVALRVAGAATGLIAVGDSFTENTVMRSTDGREWSAADDLWSLFNASHAEFVRSGDDLYAFIYDDMTTAVWRSADTVSWTHVGEVDGFVRSAAVGPLGWIASGPGKLWLSGDAGTWHRVRNPPVHEPRAMFVDAAGYVLATRSDIGCGDDWSLAVGSTWTSVDGLDWQRMKLDWQGRWLDALFSRNRTLIGVGQAHEATDTFGFVRTAVLPNVGGPAPSPTPQPTPTLPPDTTC